MDLDKISEVVETIDAKDVKRFVDAGWVLISIAPGKRGDDDGSIAGESYFLYALGNPEGKASKPHPTY